MVAKAEKTVKAKPGPKKKEKVEEVELTPVQKQYAKLMSVKAGGVPLNLLFKMANEYTDMDVECISTGFASFDRAVHPELLGLPRGRDIEISSTEGSAGKTTWCMQVAKHWQSRGLQVALAEPEKTGTTSYNNTLGIITDISQTTDPNIYPMLIMRPSFDYTTEESTIYSAEQFLNAIGRLSQIVDLIIVDSVAALFGQSDLDKESDDNSQMGGISKLLSEYFKRWTSKKATILWINQTRQAIGKFSPGGGTPLVTPGGKAMSFYASIRIKAARIASLKESDDDKDDVDPYGFLTEFKIFKNKVAPPDRRAVLPYVHGEGFSIPYDLFNLAGKMKLIEKKGAWYQFPPGDVKKNPEIKEKPGYLRTQGKLNFYRAMRDNPLTCRCIQAVLDGEEISPEDFEIMKLAGMPTENSVVLDESEIEGNVLTTDDSMELAPEAAVA